MTTTESSRSAAVESGGRGPLIDEALLERLMAQVDAEGVELLGPDGILTELTSRIMKPDHHPARRCFSCSHRRRGPLPVVHQGLAGLFVDHGSDVEHPPVPGGVELEVSAPDDIGRIGLRDWRGRRSVAFADLAHGHAKVFLAPQPVHLLAVDLHPLGRGFWPAQIRSQARRSASGSFAVCDAGGVRWVERGCPTSLQANRSDTSSTS